MDWLTTSLQSLISGSFLTLDRSEARTCQWQLLRNRGTFDSVASEKPVRQYGNAQIATFSIIGENTSKIPNLPDMTVQLVHQRPAFDEK